MPNQLYFKQLLAGRDFARQSPAAAQMQNFAYLIGDRDRGDCLVVAPARDARGPLHAAAAADSSTRITQVRTMVSHCSLFTFLPCLSIHPCLIPAEQRSTCHASSITHFTDGSKSRPGDQVIFTRRSRRALVTTETEDRLMAAAAMIGLRRMPKPGYRMPAATGTPSPL